MLSYTITKPTRAGYNFKGYFTGANGSGTQYVNENGACINNLYAAVAGNTTLYAYWTIAQTTLILNQNGGTLSGSSSNVSYAQNYGTTRTLPVPTREGYTFKGWRSVSAGGEGEKIGNLGRQISNGGYGNDSFFASGNNVVVYNNLNNGNVIFTRESTSLPQSPYNTQILKISNVGTASPGLGGFTFNMPSYANAEFISVFEAKIPVGYTVNWATNQIGHGGSWSLGLTWLTSREGTGDWET